MSIDPAVEISLQNLKKNSIQLRSLATATKNRVLRDFASRIHSEIPDLLEANLRDLESLSSDSSSAFRDRLLLNPLRVASMVDSLQKIAELPDPVGKSIEQRILKNGLKLNKVQSPLGVIFMIFESRPNVIIEAFALAFKAGNSIILRGGKESQNTAKIIYRIISECLEGVGLVQSAFLGIENYDRKLTELLLKRKDLIDVVVPRGGENLIDFVLKTSLIPIIKNDRGMCHTYVDETADLKMAVSIVANAKTQRPGVCNALETVLVHHAVARSFIPMLYQATKGVGLKWKVDPATFDILKNEARVEFASEQSWDTEYLDFEMNCRIVDNLNQAIEHIEKHGSRHSEAIVTSSEEKARHFQNEVDAAVVYWNASTRFTDGYLFELGGELGISTQKLHVRGPVGLQELTSPRWIVDGTGQVRS